MTDKTQEANSKDPIAELSRDFICPSCHELLSQPVSTKCGHTFCKNCLLRSLFHKNRCPQCKTVIHISPNYGVNILLSKVLQTFWPTEYDNRLEEEIEMKSFKLPILITKFVLFPGQKSPLNITEPRYKLMMKRVLEGGGRFGLISIINGVTRNVGTYSTVESYVILPDGNYLVSTLGLTPFKVIESKSLDGYTTCFVELIEQQDDMEIIQSPTDNAGESSVSLRMQRRNHEEEEEYGCFVGSGNGNANGNGFVGGNGNGNGISSEEEKEESAASFLCMDSDEDSKLGELEEKFKNDEEFFQSCVNNIVEGNRHFSRTELFLIGKRLFLENMSNAMDAIQKNFGNIPNAPVEFSFWLSAILPLSLEKKQLLLEIASPSLRLIEIIKMLRNLTQK